MRYGVRAIAAWLAGCLIVLAAHAAGNVPRAIEVASGVYMLPGEAGEEPTAANLGRFGNAGFIVGPKGVLVIDMGTSYRHGKALLAAIAAVTAQPVKLAVVTHTRQDFLFGGMAFRERGIPIAMQTAAAELMAARCENCLKTLRQQLGDEPMTGTAMYKADRLFDDGKAIDGQALIGRQVAVLYYGHSSGPGDVAVLDERTGVLFAGGMIDRDRIPDIGDSDLPGWHRALAALRALPVKVVVPGHGQVGGPSAIDDIERYLSQLEARARALIKSDTPLSEAADATELPDFAGWQQYDTVHRRNAAIAYLRVEREQLLK